MPAQCPLARSGSTMASPMTDSPASASIAPTRLALGRGQGAFDDAARRARDERWVELLFDRDASLWSTNERVRAALGDRLGWLDSPGHFSSQIGALCGVPGRAIPRSTVPTQAPSTISSSMPAASRWRSR